MDSGALHKKKIILGITGSISAYKSAFLARLLVKNGAEVKVVMTPSAVGFISPLTLFTLTGHEVMYGLADDGQWNNHVALGIWADLILIAPLSANTLAKMAGGICDNLLLAVYLSAKCPVFVAPAMDLDMWKHPATKNNISTIKKYGNTVIPVGFGELASGLTGEGRLAEPEEIVANLKEYFSADSSSLSGKIFLVTAGPTYENIDPVRFIGNASSGKMGLALTKELLKRGAGVKLVIGPVSEPIPDNSRLEVCPVRSAGEMAEKAMEIFPGTNGAVFSAAVSDFTPATVLDKKYKKGKEEDIWSVQLVKTADIAASLGKIKTAGQVNIGFALETDDEERNALSKLETKNLDFIVLNSMKEEGAGFEYDTNKVVIYKSGGERIKYPLKSKTEVAVDIVDELEKHFKP